MSIVPYLKPQLDGDFTANYAMYVAGSMPSAKPAMAYTGEVSIFNQIGECTVRQLAGDTLPVGHSISCVGDKVRIIWPEYAEGAAPITNPGFEDLLAGWTPDAGWTVGGTNPISGLLSAKFVDKTGESVIHSNSRYPVSDSGGAITAQCAVRQGSSSAGNAGAGVRLEYRDGDGTIIRSDTGNMVMSGSNNQVKQSKVSSMPPIGTGITVNVAGVGLRKRQNRDVWIDDFTWNMTVAAAGVNHETTYNLLLEVTDSTGRIALWSGSIAVFTMRWDYGWTGTSNNDLSTFPVAYSKTLNRALTVATSGVRYTDDAETWTVVAGPNNYHAGGPVWAESFDRFLLFMSNSGNANPVQMSQTGEPGTWVPFNFATSGYAYMAAPCYAHDLGAVYVFGGNESNRQVSIITSPTSGTINNVPGPTGAPSDVRYAWRIGGYFYVSRSDYDNPAARLWRSPDGFNGWEQVGPTAGFSDSYKSMAGAPNGRIVLTGTSSGAVYTSPDGSPGSFTRIPPFTGFTFTPSGVCYVPDLGLFVVISNSESRFLTSADGVEFTARDGFPPGNYATPTWCGPGIDQIIACRGGGGVSNGFVVSTIES